MQKLLRRLVSLSLVALLLVSALAGCSSEPADTQEETTGSGESATTSEETTQETGTEEPVTLTILMGNTTNTAGMDAVFAQMEQDIGITMEAEIRPTGAEGENIVRSRLASGDFPDINMFNAGSLFATLNPSENFVDITNEPFMDRVLDSYKESVTFDGVTYGIPATSTNAGAWIYNKAIYEELGLEVPSTWDELMENCQIIKDSGKTAIIASFGTDWTSQLVLLADFYNVHTNDPDFAANFDTNQDKYATNEYAFMAFDHMEEIWNKGFFNEDYTATTYDQAIKMLADGEGAHYPMLTHAVGNVAENYGVEAANGLGAFGQPGDDPDNHGLTVWMPDTFYFYSGSDKIDDMMRFADYYLSETALEIFADNQSADGPYVVEGATLPDDALSPIKDLIPYFDAGKTAPALEFISSVKGPNSPQICIQVSGGLVDAQTGAEEYDLDVEKQAKQLGLEGW